MTRKMTSKARRIMEERKTIPTKALSERCALTAAAIANGERVVGKAEAVHAYDLIELRRRKAVEKRKIRGWLEGCVPNVIEVRGALGEEYEQDEWFTSWAEVNL